MNAHARSPLFVRTTTSIAIIIAIWLSAVLLAQSAEEEQRTLLAAIALLVLIPPLIFIGQNPFGAEVLLRGDLGSRVALAVFWLAALIGAMFSLEPFTAAAYLAATALVTAVCCRLWYLDEEAVERGLRLYAVFGSLCLVALTLTFGYELNQRLASFRNPNGIGLLCYGTACMALAIRSVPTKLLVIGVAVTILALTGSRTSVAGLLIALTAYSIPFWRRASLNVRLVAAAIGLLLGLAVVSHWDAVWEQVSEIFAFDDPYRGLDSGFTGRDVLWQYALQLFYDNPYWGVGFRLHERYYAMSNPDIALPGSAHNGYLAALAELGITGAVPLFVWLLLRLFALAKAPVKSSLDAVTLPFVLGYLAIALFERFLINLGNPTSLIFLMLLVRPRRGVH
jgi:O-antigen ligase